jgi:hypothetical protein
VHWALDLIFKGNESILFLQLNGFEHIAESFSVLKECVQRENALFASLDGAVHRQQIRNLVSRITRGEADSQVGL